METGTSAVQDTLDRNPGRIFLGVLLAGAAIAAAAYAVEPHFFMFYGDANSRLTGSRSIVDSAQPGLHWLGTVWLPLPQLLFLPFALIDPLFFTGLAGFAVCMPLLAWSASLLYGFAKRLTGSRGAALFAALFFALNPNMLYISMTAMTETIAVFFSIAAVYNAWVWLSREEEGGTAVNALLAGMSAAAATLCRYEAWMLAGVVFAALCAASLRGSESPSKRALYAALSLTCFLGIILWLLWNRLQFGDALFFHNAEYYSAAWQARNRPVRAMYYLQLWNTFDIYSVTVIACFGIPALCLAAPGAALFARRKPAGTTAFLFTALLIMPAFTLYSLYAGVAEMTRWWNSRYALLLLPFIAISLGFTARFFLERVRDRRARIPIIAAFAAGVILQTALQQGGVVAVADAAGGFYYMQTPHAAEIGEILKEKWEGGNILAATGSGQSHRIMQSSWISTSRFTTALNSDKRNLDFAHVVGGYEWIVVGLDPAPDGAEIAAHWRENESSLLTAFTPEHKNRYFLLYRRMR